MNTAQEWNNAFDLHYNNADKSAPELNTYEKSLFLTKAQDELVLSYYNGKNQFQEGFENTEEIRRSLDKLVKRATLYPYTGTDIQKLNNKNTIIKMLDKPDGENTLWFIVQEKITFSSGDICIDSQEDVKVIPILHDEYNMTMNNPFKRPNQRKVLRLDFSGNNTSGYIELASKYPISDYKLVYVKSPKPIILDDISNSNPEYSGLNLTIKGLDNITLCELRENIHDLILNRAVELAIRDYRESTLGNQIETNQRNF